MWKAYSENCKTLTELFTQYSIMVRDISIWFSNLMLLESLKCQRITELSNFHCTLSTINIA